MLPTVRVVPAILLALAFPAFASEQGGGAEEKRTERFATVSLTSDGARFAVLGPVTETRLEVFGPRGEPMHNSGFLPGNVRDWKPELGPGQLLADGEYLCLVTARAVDGRVSVRQGRLVVVFGQLALQLSETDDVAGGREDGTEPDERMVPVAEGRGGGATLTAHDGREGQVISTSGDLTLRTGDFFAGRDEERVRVTADGRVGIGTAAPEATLDVAGTVRAQKGFAFSDGTILSSDDGRLTFTDAKGLKVPGTNAAGTGTQNRLAKWAESGGAGTLTDAAVIESGGKVGIGIGNATPSQTLHVFGKSLFENTGTASLFILDRTDGKIAALGAGGASATLAYDQSGIFKIESNSRATISQGVFGAAQGATTRMAIDGVGNVGIGTDTPGSVLHVVGRNGTDFETGGTPAPTALHVIGGTGGAASMSSQTFGLGGAGANVHIEAGDGGSGFAGGAGGTITLRAGDWGASGSPVSSQGTSSSIVLQPGNGPSGSKGSVFLAPEFGDVRVGGHLIVDALMQNSGAIRPGIMFGFGAATGIASNMAAGGNLNFYTDGGRRITITRTGEVGIGTSEPAAKAHVLSVVSTSYPMLLLEAFSVQDAESYLIQTSVDAGSPFSVRVDGAVFGASFNQTSDREQKTDFADVDSRGILERLAMLPVQTWRYRTEKESVRHIGPTAQDFRAAFAVGESDRHITTVDEGGVALAAIQALYDEIKVLRSQVRTLQDASHCAARK